MIRSLYLGGTRVDAEIRDGVQRVVPLAALARVLVTALRAGGAPEPSSVGLILTDDLELAELNAAHMGKEGPTDVLSFPLLPPEAYPEHDGGPLRPVPAKGPLKTPTAPAFLLPPGTRLHLGDILVSVERAVDQAADGRGGQTGDVHWAPADELRLLVAHGGLHLCGWDHADPVEEAAMRAREREILGAR